MTPTPTVASDPTSRCRADEIAAFLATQRRAVVAALDAGAPVGTVADLRLVDGAIAVTLAHDDPCAALLAVDDRVCVIAEQFPAYYEIKGVAAHGPAQPSTASADAPVPTLGLDDLTSFDFGKLPRDRRGLGQRPLTAVWATSRRHGRTRSHQTVVLAPGP